jgi:uncharacterized membrane protein YesL
MSNQPFAYRLPAPLRVIWLSLIDWWDNWLIVATLNLIWGVAVLTLVFAAPATFGVYHAVNELASGRSMGVPDFWVGFRRYFVKSYVWLLINAVFFGLAIVAVDIYGRMGTGLTAILQIVVVIMSAVWVITNFFALPFLMEQTTKSLPMALRNGLFTALATPPFTIVVLIAVVLIAYLCYLLIAIGFLGGAMLLVIIGTRATLDRVAHFGVRQRDAQRGSPQTPSDEP